MTKQTPPAFCLHAGDDKSVENSVAVYLAQKQFGIPAELHIYAKGGHGFGMRKSGGPVNDWPNRVAEWMKSMGYIP